MYTILVIDDHSSCRRTTARLLRLEGYNVLVADSASAGVAALESHTVDLVLLDLMMPEVDGEGFLKFLQTDARFPDLPVILTTSLPFSRMFFQTYQPHLKGWLTKAEFSGEDLLAAVKRHVKGHAAAAAN